jgi:branched-chain amino acid transport system ATP-binding protein
MLRLADVHAFYGKSHVLHGVTLDVAPGEIVALLGRNGSGRSTTAKAVMGLVDVRGSLTWNGRSLAGLAPYEVARRGIGYVPENRDIFPRLTVHQNLMLGQKSGAAVRGKPARWTFEDMYALFPRLRERQHTEAGVLSGGEQQMLALSRAFLSRPSVVLVDEASMGLAPKMVDQIFDVLGRLASDGVSVLIVEQYARRALELADYAYVLSRGEVVLSGPTREIAYADVAATYLS